MDILSYLLGRKAGASDVVIEDTAQYTFTDENSDGNVVMTESEGD